jgi:hypothetical protein
MGDVVLNAFSFLLFHLDCETSSLSYPRQTPVSGKPYPPQFGSELQVESSST